MNKFFFLLLTGFLFWGGNAMSTENDCLHLDAVSDQEFITNSAETLEKAPRWIRIGCWPNYTMFWIKCDLALEPWERCAARACGVTTTKAPAGQKPYVLYSIR
jgi:hypothetical protein